MPKYRRTPRSRKISWPLAGRQPDQHGPAAVRRHLRFEQFEPRRLLAGVTVQPTTGETSEMGDTAEFAIFLTSQPQADVVIDLESSNVQEGTIVPARVTFTPANWDTAHLVTVTGQDDDVADGNTAYTIATSAAQSADSEYDGITVPDIALINLDNDSAGILVQPLSGETTEAGETATFAVVLTSRPLGDVMILLSSSDETEGVVNPTSVTFSPETWDAPQQFVVTGQDDDEADGNIGYTIVTGPATSLDLNYDGRNPADVSMTNRDDDFVGIRVQPTMGETSEDGESLAISIVLTSRPTANVILDLASSDPSEGTVSVSQVTFSPENWDVPQIATVVGQDDFIADGDIPYSVLIAPAQSADLAYRDRDPNDVMLLNRDNDTAGLVITGAGALATSEAGGASTFVVALAAQPESDVVVQVRSDSDGEGVVSVSQLIFTPATWSNFQPVTVTGVDDPVVDGDIIYAIVLEATSEDPTFSNLAPTTLSATNTDDDFAQLVLTVSSMAVLEGTQSTSTSLMLEVELIGQVAGGVDVTYGTLDGTATVAGDDYLATTGTLSFQGNDGEKRAWSVDITADNIVEPDEVFTVALGPLSGVSPDVASRIELVEPAREITILDDDETAITLFGVSLSEGTGDAPTAFVFDVILSNPVQGGLRIEYTTDDGSATAAGGDYIDNDGSLTFEGLEQEQHPIEVLVVAGRIVERTETFSVTLTEVIFLDPILAASIVIEGGSQVGTIINDDTATIAFDTPASVAAESAGAHRLDIRLHVSDEGTISEDLTGEFVVLPGGTATLPEDFGLDATTVTFPAGSQDGDLRSVTMQLVTDDGDEDDEQVRFGLQLVAGDMDGAITVGAPGEHEVTVTDDPMTASVSGRTWFDANANGQLDPGELGIPGVLVQLSGADVRGQAVYIARMTDEQGNYQFGGLPAGIYTVNERQPAAFVDGRDTLGQVDGLASGIVTDDDFSQIVLPEGAQGTGYDFGEQRLTWPPLSRRLFLASTPPLDGRVGDVVANAEANAGNVALSEVIRQAESFELRRLGDLVTLTGTDVDDVVRFIPAGSTAIADTSAHLVVFNGLEWRFARQEVDAFVFDGRCGADTLALYDSPRDDVLTANHDAAILSSRDFRVDAIAYELIRAISSSGGEDQVIDNGPAYGLQLEGPWNP